MADDVRNVRDALATAAEHWQPHRLTSINDYDLKVVTLQGEFVWHTHPDTDELFMVVSGQLTIQLRDRDVVLGPRRRVRRSARGRALPEGRRRGARAAVRTEGHRQHGGCRGRSDIRPS